MSIQEIWMAGHEQSQTTCSDIQAGKVHNSISQLVELTTNNIAYSPAVGVAEDAALVCCGRLSTDKLGIVCFWLSLIWDIQFLGSQLLFVSLILKLSVLFFSTIYRLGVKLHSRELQCLASNPSKNQNCK